MTFAGFRFSASSVGTAYCHGCTVGCTGAGGMLVASSAGRPCTTSGSSGVPRPVGRPPRRRRVRRRGATAAATTAAAPATGRRADAEALAAVAVHREIVRHAVDDRARVIGELRPQQRADNARSGARAVGGHAVGEAVVDREVGAAVRRDEHAAVLRRTAAGAEAPRAPCRGACRRSAPRCRCSACRRVFFHGIGLRHSGVPSTAPWPPPGPKMITSYFAFRFGRVVDVLGSM